MSRPRCLKPTQDFVDGHLHYGVRMGEAVHLVRSDHTVMTPVDRDRLAIRLAPTWLRAANFSPEGLADYMTGHHIPAPEIYQRVRRYIGERVYLKPEPYRTLLALWTMGTYVHRIFRYYPYLWVHGTVPRCGKLTLLETLQPVVFNGLLCVDLYGRTLAQVCDSAPTLLLDIRERLAKRPLSRVLLGAGFRQGPCVPAWQPGPHGVRLRRYSLYSPKVLIGDTPQREFFWDKSLSIGMVPKEPNVRLVRDRDDAETRRREQALRDDLYIFALNYATEIAKAYSEATSPFGLKGVRDRERDLWQPLFGLAHLVDQEMDSHEIVEELAELR